MPLELRGCLCPLALVTLTPCWEVEVPHALSRLRVCSLLGRHRPHSDGSPLALFFGCSGAEAPWSVGTNPENVDGFVNGSVSLVCDIHSQPAAEITWYKDGHVLQLGEEVTATPGTLGRARTIVCAPVNDSEL